MQRQAIHMPTVPRRRLIRAVTATPIREMYPHRRRLPTTREPARLPVQATVHVIQGRTLRTTLTNHNPERNT
jgi:hypothetical protein